MCARAVEKERERGRSPTIVQETKSRRPRLWVLMLYVIANEDGGALREIGREDDVVSASFELYHTKK